MGQHARDGKVGVGGLANLYLGEEGHYQKRQGKGRGPVSAGAAKGILTLALPAFCFSDQPLQACPTPSLAVVPRSLSPGWGYGNKEVPKLML